MSKPVTIRFIGDETKFRDTTDAVGGRLKGFGKQVEDASEKTGKYGDRLGSLSERTDNSERNLIGLHDVIDGTAAIMAGPGEAGIAAYVQGWADLAGGVTPLIESIKNVSRETISNAVASTRAAAATIRKGVVETAAAVKTRALAVAQGILNAVLAANPIVLVVAAIVLIVGALVRWYMTSQRARDIINGAFRAIRNVITGVWNWIRSNWPLLLAILTGPIGAAVIAIVRNWDKIKSGASSAFNAVVSFMKGIPGRIRGAIGNLGSVLFNAGKRVIQGLIDGILNGLGPLGDALRGVGSFIADHKGPESEDLKLLQPAGRAIMRGLMLGIDQRTPALGRQLSDLTGMIGGFKPASAGGPSITIHARTNANAAEIAREVAWALRTSGR